MRAAALEGLVGTCGANLPRTPSSLPSSLPPFLPPLLNHSLTHLPVMRIRSTGGMQALAVSTVGILGACRIWPKFERALSVSSKTALIATPFFGTFVLLSELELNACARRARDAQLLLSQQKRANQLRN